MAIQCVCVCVFFNWRVRIKLLYVKIHIKLRILNTYMLNFRMFREKNVYKWKICFSENSSRMLHYYIPKSFSIQTSDRNSETFFRGVEGREQRKCLSSYSSPSPNITARLEQNFFSGTSFSIRYLLLLYGIQVSLGAHMYSGNTIKWAQVLRKH